MIVNSIVKSARYAPQIIPYERWIPVLCSAIVGMQLSISFAQSMTFKKVMHIRNCAVRTFSGQNIFANKKVYLARNCFATNAKECTFPRCLEINWSWLVGIWGVMKLLSVIVGVMYSSIEWAGFACFGKVHFFEKTLNMTFRFLTTALVMFTPSRGEAKVFLLGSQASAFSA